MGTAVVGLLETVRDGRPQDAVWVRAEWDRQLYRRDKDTGKSYKADE